MTDTTTNAQDQALAAIAKQVLAIPTLEPRYSDRLDFHQVGVWGLHKALKTAWARGYEEAVQERKAIDNASLAALRVCRAINEYAHKRYSADTIPDDLVTIVAEADDAVAKASGRASAAGSA